MEEKNISKEIEKDINEQEIEKEKNREELNKKTLPKKNKKRNAIIGGSLVAILALGLGLGLGLSNQDDEILEGQNPGLVTPNPRPDKNHPTRAEVYQFVAQNKDIITDPQTLTPTFSDKFINITNKITLLIKENIDFVNKTLINKLINYEITIDTSSNHLNLHYDLTTFFNEGTIDIDSAEGSTIKFNHTYSLKSDNYSGNKSFNYQPEILYSGAISANLNFNILGKNFSLNPNYIFSWIAPLTTEAFPPNLPIFSNETKIGHYINNLEFQNSINEQLQVWYFIYKYNHGDPHFGIWPITPEPNYPKLYWFLNIYPGGHPTQDFLNNFLINHKDFLINHPIFTNEIIQFIFNHPTIIHPPLK